MVAKKGSCMRCNNTNEIGIVPDFSAEGIFEAVWFRGEPKKSKWFGYKLKRKEGMPITTYRCTRCGFLEFFAHEREH